MLPWHSGWLYNKYSKCVQGRRATITVETIGRLGGAKRGHRKNLRSPWQESCRKLRGGGDWERATCSRRYMEVVFQYGNSEFWDGDRRRSGGKITFCGRRIFWDRDRGRPDGRMNSCGIYGRD